MPYTIYLDESGNTGLKVDDPSQPIFWIGALMLPQESGGGLVEVLAKARETVNVSELHANELGEHRIEAFAGDIVGFIETEGQFLVIEAEKSWTTFVQLADYIVNPLINEGAVLGGFQKPSRSPLLHVLRLLVTESDLTRYWEVETSHDLAGFEQLLWSLENRLALAMDGDEWVGIALSEALHWLLDHLESVFPPAHKNFSSPNLIALPAAFRWADQVLSIMEETAVAIIHDEQSQFRSAIAEAYGQSRGWKFSTDPEMPFPVADTGTALPAEITFQKSSKSDGLQLVDLLLWVYVRGRQGRLKPGCPGCQQLYQVLEDRGILYLLTESALEEEGTHNFYP